MNKKVKTNLIDILSKDPEDLTINEYRLKQSALIAKMDEEVIKAIRVVGDWMRIQYTFKSYGFERKDGNKVNVVISLFDNFEFMELFEKENTELMEKENEN